MRQWPAAAIFVTITLALVACGKGPGASVPLVSPPTGALIAWAGFPAGQVPRPVVLIGNPSPQDGFASGDAKIAALCHKFAAGTTLSTTVPGGAAANWANGTTATFPAISAAAALAAMKQVPPSVADPNCATVAPLMVMAARFGPYDYITDRGGAQIDSWLFKVSGADGEFAYPAIATQALWNASLENGSPDGGATMSGDGMALTFTFWGAPSSSGPCGAEYRGVVAESSSAVAVAVQTIPNAAPGDSVACPAVAQQRTVTVTLASPIGGRVLVNAAGAAVVVCQEDSARGC